MISRKGWSRWIFFGPGGYFLAQVDIFRSRWISTKNTHIFSQVEKISKLILGEIRQIRQNIEIENCHVSPPTAEQGVLPGNVETPKINPNTAVFTISNGIAASSSIRGERQDEKSVDTVEEKLRAEVEEPLFCCCSWPRTRLLTL